LLKICLSAGYLIYGVYGHFIDTNGLSLPGLKTPSNPNVRVLDIENFKDYLFATLYTGLFYFAKYILIAEWMESTNSIPKTEYRIKMT
jgi:hypothetical protein